MVSFKEFCFTALTMLAECISSLTHRGLVYVVEISPKDKKSKNKISPKLLKETKPQKPQSKTDSLGLKKFHTFPRTCTQMYRDSPASTAQGKKRHNNINKPRQPSAQQASRQPRWWRAASITHHIIHAFERKTKKPPIPPFPQFLLPVLMEKISHKGMNKRGTSLSPGSPVQANARMKTVCEARSAC